MKRFGKLILLSFILFIIVGCKNAFVVENEDIEYLTGKYTVEMGIKNYGKVVIEVDADKAPITVTNFMNLVRDGSYNNNKIHRVQKGFVIQGGDLDGAKTIKGEFLANGIDNDISHERGVISMARAGDQTSGYDTASSQFFIVVDDATYLDNYYAGFGKVTKGMDIVDKICKKVTNVDPESGTILKESDMPVIEYIKEIEK